MWEDEEGKEEWRMRAKRGVRRREGSQWSKIKGRGRKLI